jgi:shikimate kinase
VAPKLVLVGAPASGKSKLAKRLGGLIGLSVVDTDKIVTRDHGPIPEIFENVGEAGFRSLERSAVVEALASEGIVSLGGGAVIDPDTRADLRGIPVALITISQEAVASRLTPGKRPLLPEGVASWAALVAEREPWYQEVSDRSFDTSSTPLDTVARDIAQWLKEVSP